MANQLPQNTLLDLAFNQSFIDNLTPQDVTDLGVAVFELPVEILWKFGNRHIAALTDECRALLETPKFQAQKVALTDPKTLMRLSDEDFLGLINANGLEGLRSFSDFSDERLKIALLRAKCILPVRLIEEDIQGRIWGVISPYIPNSVLRIVGLIEEGVSFGFKNRKEFERKFEKFGSFEDDEPRGNKKKTRNRRYSPRQ